MRYKVGDVLIRVSHPEWGHAVILEHLPSGDYRLKWLDINRTFTLTPAMHKEMVHATKLQKLLAGYDNEN
jgi:hypothetical protein